MINNRINNLALCLVAGGLSGVSLGAQPPTTLSPSSGQVTQASHIYYNIMTGERVVTILGDGQTQPTDTGSSQPVWSSLVQNPCEAAGYTTEYFFALDNNAGTSSLATGATLLDWGDISVDTVVDCVRINWVSGHRDVDVDSDGVGDGVVGLGGQWTWWDADNGRSLQSCTRLPLITFTLADLPGNIFDDGQLTNYTVDVDLVGSFSSLLTFEIGDSDGDLQGAAFGHNNVDTNSDGIGDGVSVANADRDFDGLLDSDLDGDGLFDWAWNVRFYQPGTADLDGDGVIDGDINDSFLPIGVSFAVGEGNAVDNGDGTWTWVRDTGVSDAANGQEDAFAMFAPPFGGPGGDILYAGFFWFGGFACEEEGYTPPASFLHRLYGPHTDIFCTADMTGDGVLNFFDISAFLTAFANEDPAADFSPDGVFNFFDISAFLAAFAAGCP